MAIDTKLPIPVYFQLKTLLLEQILDGRYGLADAFPPSMSSVRATGSVARR